MRRLLSVGLALLFVTILSGCNEPPVPPEVQLAYTQEQDLRRAGAEIYASGSFSRYLAALDAGRNRLTGEQGRFAWFRDYAGVATNFRALLAQGNQVRRELLDNQAIQARLLLERTTRISERLDALRDLTRAVKDSRLYNGNLSRIEVQVDEARRFAAIAKPDLAISRLDDAEKLLEETVGKFRPVLQRFMDEKQVAHWKALVAEIVGESRRNGIYVIVVNKLRRQLILYNKGVVVATYPVGLGFNPIGDKLYSGDRATPEGRYAVIDKLPNSKFHRALLINYPNAEDQSRFNEAKRRKQIPANASIGGRIEIHGGGKDSATFGCIALDNNQMSELYERIRVGTPIAIVAAMNTDNLVRIAMGKLE